MQFIEKSVTDNFIKKEQSRMKNNQNSLSILIYNINQQAFQFFQQKKFHLALTQLKKAEDILEYAAESCCKITRNLIIVILHNIVSISQHLTDLNTASNYLEGLIYNFQITNSSKANSRLIIEQTPKSIYSSISEDNIAQAQLAKYYLQYCAINSQLRKHKNAQLASKKSINILIFLIKQSQWRKDSVQQYEAKKNIFKCLIERYKSGIHDKEPISNFVLIFQKLWEKQVQLFKKTPLQSQLKLFSIGNVMILDFKHINGRPINELYKQFYYKFLLMSISLFSLATEIRLLGEKDIAESKHYHSLAILFYYVFVPFDSPYIHHIKDNYTKNYGFFQQFEYSSRMSYKNAWIMMKKDSILQSSINLQQQSVNTQQQQRRRNERLKKQNEKLKNICQAQYKPKIYIKSYEKAKSLTISHSNAKKLSIQAKKVSSRKQNINHSNPLQDYYSRPIQTKKWKYNKNDSKRDDIEQKYFEMAFKKYKSPATKRKNSISSNSSTKSNDLKNNVRNSRQRIQKIGKVKSKKYFRR